MNSQILENAFHRVDFDHELVFKFFTTFSLFEYALKSAGFLSSGDEAKPDWETFAKNIENAFLPESSPELKKAVDYFLTTPPKKQVVENGVMVFKRRLPNAADSLTQKLSVYIRRVRNNLFHGGKFRFERPRDTELVKYALIILEAWAGLHPGVRQALENIS